MTEHHKIAKSVSIISFATMTSRVLGYVRDGLFASLFGAGVISDAFLVAYRIPNLLRDLLADGAIAGVGERVGEDRQRQARVQRENGLGGLAAVSAPAPAAIVTSNHTPCFFAEGGIYIESIKT